MSIRKIITKHIADNTDSHVGDTGDIWFDPENPVLKVSNGATPGGQALSSGGGGSGAVTPNITWTGNMPINFTVRSIVPDIVVSYPSEFVSSTSGCWLNTLYYEEDTGNPGITSLTLHNVVGINNEFQVSYCESITSVSAPLLEYVDDGISFYDNPLLETINLPNLELANGQIQISDSTTLSSVVFPKLFQTDGIRFTNCSALTEIDFADIFPALIVCSSSIEIQNCSVLTSVYLSADTTGSFYIQNNSMLESMEFDFITMGYSSMYNLPALTYFRFSDKLKTITDTFGLQGSALDEASIDHILVTIAALDGTNGTTVFENKTVRIDDGTASPPSAIGLAAADILTGRGCNVQFNS